MLAKRIEAQTSETLLHAQPYDISASGFYFRSLEEYEQKSSNHKNDYGDEVEEYEIQFIDGDDLDCDLFKALKVHQGNFNHYFAVHREEGDQENIDLLKKLISYNGEIEPVVYCYDFIKHKSVEISPYYSDTSH